MEDGVPDAADREQVAEGARDDLGPGEGEIPEVGHQDQSRVICIMSGSVATAGEIEYSPLPAASRSKPTHPAVPSMSIWPHAGARSNTPDVFRASWITDPFGCVLVAPVTHSGRSVGWVVGVHRDPQAGIADVSAVVGPGKPHPEASAGPAGERREGTGPGNAQPSQWALPE